MRSVTHVPGQAASKDDDKKKERKTNSSKNVPSSITTPKPPIHPSVGCQAAPRLEQSCSKQLLQERCWCFPGSVGVHSPLPALLRNSSLKKKGLSWARAMGINSQLEQVQEERVCGSQKRSLGVPCQE